MPLQQIASLMPIQRGYFYFAPSGYHVLIDSEKTFVINVDPPIRHCRPNLDVFLKTAAEIFGDALIATILSGANEDGALGMETVRRYGGKTLVQDPRTCEISTMTKAALGRIDPDFLGSPEEIGHYLKSL